MIVGLILTVLVASGGVTPSLAPSAPDSSDIVGADSLRWQSLARALDVAAQTRRPVLVYVHAPWCGPCLRMERDVFPNVVPLLKRFALASIDYDDHDSRVRIGDDVRSPFEWARHVGADGTPTFVWLAPDGTVITRISGAVDGHSFRLLLAFVATGAYRHTTFASYVDRVDASRGS